MKVFNDPKLDKYFNPKIGLKSIDKLRRLKILFSGDIHIQQ